MTADPGPRSSRRKRTILFGTAGSASFEAHDVLSATAAEFRAGFLVSHDPEDLAAVAEAERDTLCLAVFEADLPDAVASARAVSQVVPGCELVLLASAEGAAKLRRQLGLSPRLGNHWQILSPSQPDLGKLFRAIFRRGDQRKATRTTIDRFNARLSLPAETVDTQELRQLVISDRFLSSILESAFDAVILVDREGTVAAFNPSAERLFARSQSQVLSHPIASLSPGPWAGDIHSALGTDQHGHLIHSAIETPLGSRSVEISATPVHDRSRNVIATSFIIRDVTVRLQSEQALRTNEKLAAVGRLASTIAHEINNPLEAVTNLIYLARLSTGDPTAMQYLDQADHELQRMAAITSQTLHFHKQATHPKLISCDDLFESVIGLYRTRFFGLNIDLQTRWRAGRPITCFEGEIRQVLNNLVGNALDAMQGAGGRLLLRSREATHWRSGGKGVVITVADTGSGMSPATLRKIFDAFFTTKGIGGTGLGLWVSHEIILRHGGALKVRSRNQQGASGTVFSVFLPFQAVVR